jgi:hypothetical protein
MLLLCHFYHTNESSHSTTHPSDTIGPCVRHGTVGMMNPHPPYKDNSLIFCRLPRGVVGAVFACSVVAGVEKYILIYQQAHSNKQKAGVVPIVELGRVGTKIELKNNDVSLFCYSLQFTVYFLVAVVIKTKAALLSNCSKWSA